MAKSKDNQILLAAALKKLEKIERREAFDPAKPSSRPTVVQQEIIDDFFNSDIANLWVLGGNQSGKTMLALNIVGKLMTNAMRPTGWDTELPLTGLILSRTGKQIEESILPKLEPHLEAGTYKIIRVGNMANAIHFDNGNRLVFQSYENEGVARERVQSYTLNFIVLDEMPRSKLLIEEAQRRLQARKGKFIAPFTPKLVSPEVKELVEKAKLPYSKKYILRMMDNPIYDEATKARILAELETYSESYRRTVLEGAWATADNSVFYFDSDRMVEAPENYHQGWRHVEGSDPALDSKHGLTILAENPETSVWYVIYSDYIEGITVPTDLVSEVRDRTRIYNIVKRIADSAASWFIHTARSMGIHYSTPYDKNNRRLDMIKNLQEMLGKKIKIAPWCDKLIDEIGNYQWSDRGEGKIVNADKFHLIDSFRYISDCLPPSSEPFQAKSYYKELREANELRKKNNEERSNNKIVGKITLKRRGWRR